MKRIKWSPRQKDNIMLVSNILLILGALVVMGVVLMMIAIAALGALLWLWIAICSPLPWGLLAGLLIFGVGLVGHFITPDEPFDHK